MGFLRRLLGLGRKEQPDSSRHAPAAVAPLVPAVLEPSFPFPLVTVHGSEAVAAWRRYQAEWRLEGASAVVLGDAEELGNRARLLASESADVTDVLHAAATKTARDFFRSREAEYLKNNLVVEPGEWPREPMPPSPLTAHTELPSGRPKPVVYIARIPTPRTWEIPAYLRAGGWNDCPDAECQAAVLKYWHDKFGAEIYSLTGDVLECLVARPPRTRQTALALAQEQFLFCADVVHQGTESIEVLASTLMNSEVWYFWWD